MSKLVVRYFEQAVDPHLGTVTRTLLGSEAFDGIAEAMLPGLSAKFKVFSTKKFSGNPNHHWFVADIEKTAATATTPHLFDVVLEKPYVAAPIEYLNETLRKSGRSLETTLYWGRLVEVDYGFMPSIGRDDGTQVNNDSYFDTIQSGEMHKRRLCIVVKARDGRLQVVPISSDPPSASDKTAFEVDPAALADLVRYGTSGKASYAIGSMIETASTRRVMPPETSYRRGKLRQGRNTAYSHGLGGGDKQKLREALLHVVGVTDYPEVKQRCADLITVEAERDATIDYNAALEAKIQAQERYCRLAAKWAAEMGCDLETEAAAAAASP